MTLGERSVYLKLIRLEACSRAGSGEQGRDEQQHRKSSGALGAVDCRWAEGACGARRAAAAFNVAVGCLGCRSRCGQATQRGFAPRKAGVRRLCDGVAGYCQRRCRSGGE